jgi:hypothetical protein
MHIVPFLKKKREEKMVLGDQISGVLRVIIGQKEVYDGPQL